MTTSNSADANSGMGKPVFLHTIIFWSWAYSDFNILVRAIPNQSPRVPPEIQRCILEIVASQVHNAQAFEFDLDSNPNLHLGRIKNLYPDRGLIKVGTDLYSLTRTSTRRQIDVCGLQSRLYSDTCSFSLVCRSWAVPCRRILFTWIALHKSSQFNKLFHLLRHPNSSEVHLLSHIQRISVICRHDFKTSGALSRIAALSPPKLIRIDIFGDHSRFPFHPSLQAQLSRLSQVQVILLEDIGFTHLTELRQLLHSFRGIRNVHLHYSRYEDCLGVDRMGEFRSFRHADLRSMDACSKKFPCKV